MKQYLELLRHVLENGVQFDDRTGTGTLSVFGTQTRYNLREGFPLVTTKRVNWNAIKGELAWFLEGNTNARELEERYGTKIWNDWADEDGELGPIYGAQWRSWPSSNGPIDQIAAVVESIRTNPNSRRHIVSAWNVSQLEEMALPPCHLLFQFYVRSGRLSCQLYQRSADLFLGVPFNIASYALLTHALARACDLEVGEFVHTIGDAHIYANHVDQVREQLARAPRPLPSLVMTSSNIIDAKLEGYEPHAAIKGEISV